MRGNKKLIYGVGINDADYPITRYEFSNGKERQAWMCPFYRTWRDMLTRGYSESWKTKYPTYRDCFVCEEWLKFSNFKKWMETQNWENRNLDKDLLFKDNKLYSPSTCIFITGKVNRFLLDNKSRRGCLPIGVCWHKRDCLYHANISVDNTRKYLGAFQSSQEAHQAWLTAKLEAARELAEEVLSCGGDFRIAYALVNRYEKYEE